jgi:hypothetical protein
MQNWQIVALAVAVVVLIVAAVWVFYNKNRSRRLRAHFGPEYDRTVAEFGDRRRAESELMHRTERVSKLQIRDLSVTDRNRFGAEWMACQRLFVDDPGRALEHADNLLTDVIRTRGYATSNPYDRIADISAAYPEHAGHYREAGEILAHHRRGEASTEDLRKAFLSYRTLFDDILGGQHEELKRAS